MEPDGTRALFKVAGMLGLAGSVSLCALVARAEDMVPTKELAPAEEVAPTEFLLPAAAAEFDSANAIPALDPAPVAITPQDSQRVPEPQATLPEPPPPAPIVFTSSDWLRMAMTDVLADGAVLKSLRLATKDQDALSAFYAGSSEPSRG